MTLGGNLAPHLDRCAGHLPELHRRACPLPLPNTHTSHIPYILTHTTQCKKAKWLSEEALQITVKRREVKSKGEKERYSHLNAELQRTARRDKKAFLSDQCKEIEENIRMGKTRDLFKKIRDTKGTFHAKMGTMKDRNGMDLKKQKILRRGGKNTQKNCIKKNFTTQIIMMVI